MSNKIRVPDEHYVETKTVTPHKGAPYEMGFAIPTDSLTNSSAKRAQRWAGVGQVGKSKINNNTSVIYENEDVQGFQLMSVVSRWSTSNKVWRVKDPRGDFQLEIYCGNLNHILQNATIKNGVIQEECRWGRDHNGKNYLLVKGSDLYEEAMDYKDLTDTKISLRDVNRGDVVLLHDDRKVRYLGGMYFLEAFFWRNSKPKVKRHYVFEVLEGTSRKSGWNSDSDLDTKSSISVGRVVEEADPPMTKKEAEEYANDILWSGGLRSYKFRGKMFKADRFEEQDVAFVLEDYDPSEVEDEWKVMKFFYDTSGDLYQLNGETVGEKVKKDVLLNEGLLDFHKIKDPNSGYYRGQKKIEAKFNKNKHDKLVLKAKIGPNSYFLGDN